MPTSRPDRSKIVGADASVVPHSCQRVFAASAEKGQHLWIGPDEAVALSDEDQAAYDHAFTIIRHLAVRAPTEHGSGHPGGPLSAFAACYLTTKHRNRAVDQPLRMSAGHLSVLGYGLQWLFGRDNGDERLASPEAIIATFRTPAGLPGHIEAGIGDIPFGTGPLGKGVSNALGAAFGLKYQNKPGTADVLMADGDSQEGQIQEAFRLAAHLQLDNVIVHGDFNDIQLSGRPSDTVAADFAAIAFATGWNVLEVQNGNDPAQVNAALLAADKLSGSKRPTFICYYTTMGYGIGFMEEDSNTGGANWHGSPLSKEQAERALNDLPSLEEAVAAYEPIRLAAQKQYEADHVETDLPLTCDLKNNADYTRAITTEKGAARKDFGAVHLLNAMKADKRIVVLHADLAASGGFDVVEKELPDRVFNVGVAEANMVMMAAGMRQVGLLPVTYTFAAFGTNEARASARLIDVNCGHTRCGVINDCTHAGLSVGEDGETHQEQNYLSLPFHHTEVWMPADSNQAAAMAEHSLEMIAEGHTSVFVFSPRTGHEQLKTPNGELMFGKDYDFTGSMDLVRGNGDFTDKATIIASSISLHHAVAVADKLRSLEQPMHIRVLNAGSIRPIDSSAILQAALETSHILVVEDHNVSGGLASQVADVLADFGAPCSLRRLGLTHYLPSGPAKDIEFIAGLDPESIEDAVLDEIRVEVCGGEDALVSFLYEFPRRQTQSIHAEKAHMFSQKLLLEKGYIEALRQQWSQRSCPVENLPKTDDLLKRLGKL